MNIDITYLEELVLELKNLIKESEDHKAGAALCSIDEQKILDRKVLVAMCKAAGVCLGISQEGALLVGDINKIVSVGGQNPKKEDSLDGLLNKFLKPQKINN